MEDIKIIESLPLDRWEDYRNLRISSITQNPKAFGKTKKDISMENEYPVDYWVDILNDSYTKIFFAQDQTGKLVGMIKVRIYTYTNPTVHIKCSISHFFVEEKYRNKKIGLVLFKTAIEFCESKNASEVFLNVVFSQKNAYLMYRKLGFKTTSWGFNIKKLILYRNMSLKI